jgi:hypothetical protein
MSHTPVSVEEVKGMFDSVVYERGPEAGIDFLMLLNETHGKTRADYIAIYNASREQSAEPAIGLLH